MKFSSIPYFICCLATAGTLSSREVSGKLSYNHDVRPILSENCFQCHGPDSNARKSDLRLDVAEEAYQDRDGSIAIVPGNPEESLLVRMIHSEDEENLMPPPDSNRSLTNPEKEILKRWIEEGAEYEKHWAFIQPIKRQPLVNRPNPVDGFIEARLDKEGLTLSREADPKTWLRRVSFDLTGLPPSVEEYQSFEAEVMGMGDRAYEQRVDTLLDSMRFGEHMAVDWMDAARYADTHGFNNDSERSMWRWRDWVIDAFNRNQPYDQFITEQLAGDLLPTPSLDQLIATGFNRNHVISSEGGIIEEEYRVEYVADRVRTVGMVWMGLTTECARCHDHKFDEFSQKDYYRLFAFFNSLQELGEDGRVANAWPIIPAPTANQQKRLNQLENYFEEAAGIRNEILNSFPLSKNHLEVLRNHLTNLEKDGPNPVWKISSATEFTEDSFLSSGITSESDAGISGAALSFEIQKPTGSIKADTIAINEKNQAFSLAFWLNPAKGNAPDTPLLSNAKFERKPSSSRFGQGWDARLVDGEIEFSAAQRYPGYSMIIRTLDAEIQPDEWRHVMIRFQGKTKEESNYTPASHFSILVDGVESRLHVRFDGLLTPPDVKKHITSLGSDSKSGSKPFQGRLDEIQQFDFALSDNQAKSVFKSEVLPYLVDKQSNDHLSSREQRWLKEAVLDQTGNPRWLAVDLPHRKIRRDLLAENREIPSTMIARELEEPRATFVLRRGHYASPGEEVQAGVPESLIAPWPSDAPLNRLGLAQWLTDDQNPMTARVVVNRFWQQLFGVGLVKTAEDFGVQSEYPSHPKLLDWLAVDFMESGWDVKRILKKIVLSKTYRQQSNVSPKLLAVDPENRLLARGPRFRLPAEAVRDQALALSGLLVEQIGGPSVRPYQPKGIYNSTVVGANYPGTQWMESEGGDLYRRSIYTFWKRTLPYPALAVFDAPEREVCTVSRARTNTPLQALVTMNDPTYVEASHAMAVQLLSKRDISHDERIREAFLMVTGRWPDKDETTVLDKAFSEMRNSFQQDPNATQAFLDGRPLYPDDQHSPEELAAYASLMSLLLNLDESLTKG